MGAPMGPIWGFPPKKTQSPSPLARPALALALGPGPGPPGAGQALAPWALGLGDA